VDARRPGGGPDPRDPIRQDAGALGEVPTPVIIDDEKRGDPRPLFPLGRGILRIVLVTGMIRIALDVPFLADEMVDEPLEPADIRSPERAIEDPRDFHCRCPVCREAGIAEVRQGIGIRPEGQRREGSECAAPKDAGDLPAYSGNQDDRDPVRRGGPLEFSLAPWRPPTATGQQADEREDEERRLRPPRRFGRFGIRH
jgi:hypothetical protein